MKARPCATMDRKKTIHGATKRNVGYTCDCYETLATAIIFQYNLNLEASTFLSNLCSRQYLLLGRIHV